MPGGSRSRPRHALRRRRRCGPTIASRARPAPAFHPALDIRHAELVIRKGFRRDQFLFGLLRERPHHADRPRRLSARARPRAVSSGRAGDGFLRALFGARRAPARLRGHGDRGGLPRHRSRRIAGRGKARHGRRGRHAGGRSAVEPVRFKGLRSGSRVSTVPDFAVAPRSASAEYAAAQLCGTACRATGSGGKASRPPPLRCRYSISSRIASRWVSARK